MYIRPFEAVAATSNIAVTASSQALAITGAGVGTRSIRVANVGTQTIFITLGISTVTGVLATSMPVLANTVETYLLRKENTHVGVIAASTGSTMYLTVGESA